MVCLRSARGDAPGHRSRPGSLVRRRSSPAPRRACAGGAGRAASRPSVAAARHPRGLDSRSARLTRALAARLAICFCLGAVLGTALDAIHVYGDVETYLERGDRRARRGSCRSSSDSRESRSAIRRPAARASSSGRGRPRALDDLGATVVEVLPTGRAFMYERRRQRGRCDHLHWWRYWCCWRCARRSRRSRATGLFALVPRSRGP